MLPSNPGNHAKQPKKHWQATLPGTLPTETGPPLTIDAITLSEVIVLTISATIHGQSSRHSCMISPHILADPIPWHYNNNPVTLAGGATLSMMTGAVSIGAGQGQGISFVAGAGRR